MVQYPIILSAVIGHFVVWVWQLSRMAEKSLVINRGFTLPSLSKNCLKRLSVTIAYSYGTVTTYKMRTRASQRADIYCDCILFFNNQTIIGSTPYLS